MNKPVQTGCNQGAKTIPCALPERLFRRSQPCKPLGAGRRAATLRSRVRAVKRFLVWLAVAHGKGTSRHVSQSRIHGSSRRCHRTGMSHDYLAVSYDAERTPCQLTLGRPTEQAPMMFVAMVAAIEELTVDENALSRCLWILLQSCGRNRFSYHSGCNFNLPFSYLIDNQPLDPRVRTRVRSFSQGFIDFFPNEVVRRKKAAFEGSCFVK